MSTLLMEYSKHFEYRDGNLYWKHDRGSQKCKGKEAGTVSEKGYIRVRVRELGGSIGVHQVIFAMHHGYLPHIVDHIDGNPANNRIENLRAATKAENCRNSKMPKHNTSGVKNVSWHKANKKWAVHLNVNNHKRFFGLHDNIEFADLVAHEARDKYYGEFANNGVKNVRA